MGNATTLTDTNGVYPEMTDWANPGAGVIRICHLSTNPNPMSLTLLRSHTTYKGFSLLEAGKWCAAIVLGATLSQAAWGQDSLVYLPGKMYVIRITPYVDSQEVLEPLMKEKLRPLLTGADGMLDYVQQDILPMQGSAHGQWFLGVFNASRQEKDMLLRDASLLRWLTGGAHVQIMPLELVQALYLSHLQPL